MTPTWTQLRSSSVLQRGFGHPGTFTLTEEERLARRLPKLSASSYCHSASERVEVEIVGDVGHAPDGLHRGPRHRDARQEEAVPAGLTDEPELST